MYCNRDAQWHHRQLKINSDNRQWTLTKIQNFATRGHIEMRGRHGVCCRFECTGRKENVTVSGPWMFICHCSRIYISICSLLINQSNIVHQKCSNQISDALRAVSFLPVLLPDMAASPQKRGTIVIVARSCRGQRLRRTFWLKLINAHYKKL